MWFVNLVSAWKCYSPGTGRHSIMFCLALPEVEPNVNEFGTQHLNVETHQRFIGRAHREDIHGWT